MVRFATARSFVLLLGAAALAGCSDGGSDSGTAALREKVEAQASEIEALKKASRDMDARARAIEERLSAVRAGHEGSRAAGRMAGSADVAPDAAADGMAPAPDAATTPTTEAVASFLETEQGKQKLAEAMEAAEKRRAKKADQETRDRMMSFVKERVTGYLTEQLGLDANQQQSVLAVAVDTTEKMTEVWRGAREARGDPAFFTAAREKTTEIRQQAVDKIQQALTVDQFTKFQEIMNDGGGGFLMGGGRGGMGGFGGGTPGGGGAPAGGTRGGR